MIVHEGLRKGLLAGAETFAKAVESTYGPMGRTVMMERAAGLISTKDGATVAKEVHLPDPIQRTGALLMRDACVRMESEVGDGTTTVSVLAAAMLREAYKYLEAGISPRDIIDGLNIAEIEALSHLHDLASPIETEEEIFKVAMMACNGDEDVARNLTEACLAAGDYGTVMIEDNYKPEVEVSYQEGMALDVGIADIHYLRDLSEIELEDCLVAVVDNSLSSVEDVLPILQASTERGILNIVLFVNEISGMALQCLYMNHTQGAIHCYPIKGPSYGEHRNNILEDIACLTGATYFSSLNGKSSSDFQVSDFGMLSQCKITSSETDLVADMEEAQVRVKRRIQRLENEKQNCATDFDLDRIKERIAKLSSGVVLLKVGSVTEAAAKERRGRVEDALASVQNAIMSGVVPGSGSTFLYLSRQLNQRFNCRFTQIGYDLLKIGLKAPLYSLAERAGTFGPLVDRDIQDPLNYQLNPSTGEVESTVWYDPYLTILKAIEIACSTVREMCTIDCAVVTK